LGEKTEKGKHAKEKHTKKTRTTKKSKTEKKQKACDFGAPIIGNKNMADHSQSQEKWHGKRLINISYVVMF